MANRISIVGALGLGLAVLGVIARYLSYVLVVNMTTMFFIINLGGWRFHLSTKEPLRKICGLGTRILQDINSERLVISASVQNFSEFKAFPQIQCCESQKL